MVSLHLLEVGFSWRGLGDYTNLASGRGHCWLLHDQHPPETMITGLHFKAVRSRAFLAEEIAKLNPNSKNVLLVYQNPDGIGQEIIPPPPTKLSKKKVRLRPPELVKQRRVAGDLVKLMIKSTRKRSKWLTNDRWPFTEMIDQWPLTIHWDDLCMAKWNNKPGCLKPGCLKPGCLKPMCVWNRFNG